MERLKKKELNSVKLERFPFKMMKKMELAIVIWKNSAKSLKKIVFK